MIQKFVFGCPVETEATVMKVEESKEKVPEAEITDAGNVRLSWRMNENDIVYGLGEQVRGINKRGFSYVSNATDDPVHTEDKRSLYGGHNFLILNRRGNADTPSEGSFGIFVDDPGKVIFDVGETKYEELVITAGSDCVVYRMEGESIPEIVRQFRRLIGQSYIPPKWAFGYQQSRWGYQSEEDVREVVEGHRSHGIPLEAVYLDIDYMEGFKDFTVDEKKFPDFEGFVREMKGRGVHLVPIIDAGVKIEKGYEIYEEGVAGNYFCKDEDGNNFVAAVWPGKVHFPDFLNARAREWFGGKYKVLTDQGIDGFWNDMNEPAIFYSEKNLKAVFEEIKSIEDDNLDMYAYDHLQHTVSGLSNNKKDYQSFYHDKDGVRMRHDQVHNLYGYNMTKAASEAFAQILPDKRVLLFSRSSYIGMHRYGGIWTGDNQSWWSHLLLSIQQMPSLNMCGILYTGSDVGGFGSDTTEDLLMRWLGFAIFTPLMRNHTSLGTRCQEVYQFGHIKEFRDIIRIRYALLPYLYSEYMKAALEDGMYFRPVAFDYPEDAFAARVEDQLMVGDSIMIAPVYTQNAKGRYVYLPEEMMMVRMRSAEERHSEILQRGHHYVDIALHEVVIFVKRGHMLPFAILDDNVKTTADVGERGCVWIGFAKDTAEYLWYQDDGVSKSYTPKAKWEKVVKSDL